MEINKGNALNDEMNSLGTSSADNKRYDELRAKKNEHFQKAAEHLEDFVEKNPNTKNLDILGQLKNIYSALGETEKYKEMKAKVEEVEAMGGGN